MFRDPIVEEVHEARRKLAEACDFDLDRMFAHLREQEQAHADRVVDRTAEAGKSSGSI